MIPLPLASRRYVLCYNNIHNTVATADFQHVPNLCIARSVLSGDVEGFQSIAFQYRFEKKRPLCHNSLHFQDLIRTHVFPIDCAFYKKELKYQRVGENGAVSFPVNIKMTRNLQKSQAQID